MVNRTQALVLGLFVLAMTSLLVILAAAPEVYDQALPLPTGNRAVEIALLAALLGFITLLGIDQWQEPWPTEDLIVWDDDDTPAATITVNDFAKAGAVDRAGAGRAGALCRQGHCGSGLRRPGPRRRAAGLGRHEGGRRGC